MIETLLRRAHKRLILQHLAADLGVSAAFLAGSVVVLLVVGSQIFDWRVLAALGTMAFATGLWRSWRRTPDLNAVARMLDRRCNLSDALATALSCRGSGHYFEGPQRMRAEDAAGTIDLRAALPTAVPRSLYALAGLSLVAVSLMVVRYGVQDRLTLSQPIARLQIDPLDFATRASEKAAPGKTPPDAREILESLDEGGNRDNPDSLDSPQGAAFTARADAKRGNSNVTAANPDGRAASAERPSETTAASSRGEEGANSEAGGRDGSPKTPQSGGNRAGQSQSSASGMLSKLRDAVSSLMSKMNSRQQPDSGSNGANQQSTAKQAGSGSQKTNKDGQTSPRDDGEERDGEQSASSDSEQASPGSANSKNGQQNATAKPGSGMGHQDGNKDLQEARQLEAMGKLSEIIGKRSANVTGEMTIESQSGPQQLKTEYSRINARHGESSSDLSRDEIPVALQGYIQQYFEQVRKQGVKTARAGKPTPHQ